MRVAVNVRVASAGIGTVVDLLLGLRQVLVPHALDRYLPVQDVVRVTICLWIRRR